MVIRPKGDIFLVNIIPKVYELVKITQNEKNNSKMSKIQTAGRKARSAMDNLITMNTIIENQRAQKLNTYMFFADAVKCFNKLWLKVTSATKLFFAIK